MLTTNQIFALKQLSAQDAFSRVLTKVNCNGLPVGTPFIIATSALQEMYKLQQDDCAALVMNPCPIGKEHKLNMLAELSYASLSISSQPTFLDLHFVKESDNAAKDFNEAFNHALGGGAASVFFKDVDGVKEILNQILPAIYEKYAYVGTLKSKYTPPSEKTVLMIQFFHPKHCCAIYYPNKVDGVVMSISAVMPTISKENDLISRPISINLFVSNFLDNILTLDGTTVASADSITSIYPKIIEACFASMMHTSKPTKRLGILGAHPEKGSNTEAALLQQLQKTQTAVAATAVGQKDKKMWFSYGAMDAIYAIPQPEARPSRDWEAVIESVVEDVGVVDNSKSKKNQYYFDADIHLDSPFKRSKDLVVEIDSTIETKLVEGTSKTTVKSKIKPKGLRGSVDSGSGSKATITSSNNIDVDLW
jgi:hypothetical protein